MYRGKAAIQKDLEDFKKAKFWAEDSITRCQVAIADYDQEILKLQKQLDNYRETIPDKMEPYYCPDCGTCCDPHKAHDIDGLFSRTCYSVQDKRGGTRTLGVYDG